MKRKVYWRRPTYPKIGITCDVPTGFSLVTKVHIDLYKGTVRRSTGEHTYIYELEKFNINSANKKINLEVAGKLGDVLDNMKGASAGATIKDSPFLFSASLPSKDGKKFKAEVFAIKSDVKFPNGAAFNLSSVSTNEIKCEMVKGAKYLKLFSGSSGKMTGDYPSTAVNDSDRSLQKEIPDSQPVTPSKVQSSQQ